MMDQPYIGNTGTFKIPETQEMPEVVYLSGDAAASKVPVESSSDDFQVDDTQDVTGNVFYETDGYASSTPRTIRRPLRPTAFPGKPSGSWTNGISRDPFR